MLTTRPPKPYIHSVLKRIESSPVILHYNPVKSGTVYSPEVMNNEHSSSPDVLTTTETDCHKYERLTTQQETRFENNANTAGHNVTTVDEINTMTETIRSSNRNKKIPVTRSNDFLWET
jgi:hypothetical protein